MQFSGIAGGKLYLVSVSSLYIIYWLTLCTRNLPSPAGRIRDFQRTPLLVERLLRATASPILWDTGGFQLASVSLEETLTLLLAGSTAELGVDRAASLVVGLCGAGRAWRLALVVAPAAL